MDTQIDHTHMRIKTLNKERSKWERGIPWHQTINVLSRNNPMYVVEQNKLIMYDHRINQS